MSASVAADSAVWLLHVPKTAGTTVRQLLRRYKVHYKEFHMNRSLKCGPADCLQDILNQPDRKVVLTWRRPDTHAWSAFNFYKEYPHFQLPRDDFESFCKVQRNPQSGFLLKHHFLERLDVPSPAQVQMLKKIIDRPNTLCIVQDCLDQGAARLPTFLNLSMAEQSSSPVKVPVNRFNFNKLPPPAAHLQVRPAWQDGLFDIDWELYHHILRRHGYQVEESDRDVRTLPKIIPWQYPLNLVAGRDSLDKYEEMLRTQRPDFDTRNPEVYVSRWIKWFINSACKDNDACGDVHTLADLEKLLSDPSPRLTMITRF